jgi:hypothetical protein
MNDLPPDARIAWGPLTPGQIAELKAENAVEPEYDDEFQTPDGREFRMSYERLTIELGSSDAPMRFTSLTQLEQAWVDLQTLFGVKSRLASDPDWREFPEPTEPSIQ